MERTEAMNSLYSITTIGSIIYLQSNKESTDYQNKHQEKST